MSGHSHYATTKRQKELKDNARGQVFSKLSRAVTLAAKSGVNPEGNFKLRIAIDKAKAASMPKENIDRAIAKAAGGGETLDEVLYEGFGPAGISLLVEVATDNKNRTNAEIKNIFEKSGGKVGSPGSVVFNFTLTGLLPIEKKGVTDDQILKLIDLGAEDVDTTGEVVNIYVSPDNLSHMQKTLTENGFAVKSAELIYKPKTTLSVPEDKVESVASFLDNLENDPDVQKVFTNATY